MIKVRHLNTALEYACLAFAVWFAACFLYVALSSLTYPFHLEWMEGHTVDIMQRLREGLPFYTKPTLEYVPYIYTPLYFYVSAFMSYFTGLSFFPARLVSFISIMGTAIILYHWIQKERGGPVLGLVAAGLFLATYKLSGRWFDVARVDSLYIFCMIAGLYVYYFKIHKCSLFIASTLFAAAFFVKQSAIMALFPCLLAALFIDRKRAFQTALITGVLIVGGCLYLQNTSHGWFSFYIYDVPAGHHYYKAHIIRFWQYDLLQNLLYIITASLSAFILLFTKKEWRAGIWYLALVVGFIGSAYASRVHSFGHVNVLIPAHLALALLGVIATARAKESNKYFFIGLAALLIAQFYSLIYDARRMVPTDEARRRGEYFIDELRKIKGKILSSEIKYLESHIGKKNYSISMAGYDIIRSDLGEKTVVKENFLMEIRTTIIQRKYDAIIMGNFIRLPELQGNYTLNRVIEQPQEFVTGAVFFNKAYIYLPLPR